MEVKISFNTEKESIDDLKRLVASLQDLINKREKVSGQIQTQYTQNVQSNPAQTTFTQTIKPTVQEQPKPQQSSGQTNGGGRVIPYEDMSNVLSKIVSGQKY
jgi:hypothetical protein